MKIRQYYDGESPFPGTDEHAPAGRAQIGLTATIVVSPFTARPWSRVVLEVAGSMSFQGNLIDWVAVHRHHHAFIEAVRIQNPDTPFWNSFPGRR